MAGTYNDDDDDQVEDGVAAGDNSSLAGATPSAPDVLSGTWWKYDVVRRVLREQPGRRVVWIDDELTHESEFTAWAHQQPGLLVIGPDPRSGLTTDDLEVIDRWLRADATTCTNCGGKLVHVVYGFPTPPTVEAAERGEVVLGGCGVWDGQPDRVCTLCR